MNLTWFQRFADVPGIVYETPPGIDPSSLPGFGGVPEEREERTAVTGDTLPEDLWWAYDPANPDARSSGSPAQMHMHGDGEYERDRSIERSEQLMAEALELPGEPSDYHRAIQSTLKAYDSRRWKDPGIFERLIELCQLDLALVAACPEAIRDDYAHVRPDSTGFRSFYAPFILTNTYLDEGFLGEALEMAELGERYGQGSERADDLRSRIAALREEDAA